MENRRQIKTKLLVILPDSIGLFLGAAIAQKLLIQDENWMIYSFIWLFSWTIAMLIATFDFGKHLSLDNTLATYVVIAIGYAIIIGFISHMIFKLPTWWNMVKQFTIPFIAAFFIYGIRNRQFYPWNKDSLVDNKYEDDDMDIF